ncbi:zinc carboxypeptidase A 1-like [Arctopsyche grandis]|uniref:zinc carboxypeptidase A 1-like n=1 Tax=Arctopsyche grandis TaxID=121162 RepID=UPI00406D9E82
MSWDSYYRLEDIHAWMDSLGAAYPKVATVISAGRSYEGRDIKGLKISFTSGRRSVFIEGGIHAREWISPATVTYLINELLTSSDPSFRRIAESFDWYIFPSVNPDGYVFTHTWYRLWRKTRTPHSTFCYGADPNRNWDFHWGEEGTSTNTCSETYGGPEAFSESETYSLSKMIESIGSELDVYLSFHSYSQILLISYGTTGQRSENFDDEYEIGKKAAEALSQKYGTEYQVGNSQEILYATSGSSSDWAKYNFQIPIVYTYELRDTGENGFLLPAEQIIPNCEEVMDSIVAIFEESEKLGYFKMGSNNTSQ